jgi:hypothetical protein
VKSAPIVPTVVLGSTVTVAVAAVPVPAGPPVTGVPHPRIVGKVAPPALEAPPWLVEEPPAPVEDPPALALPPVLAAIPPVPLPPVTLGPPELVLDPQPDVKAAVSSTAPTRRQRLTVDDGFLMFMKVS